MSLKKKIELLIGLIVTVVIVVFSVKSIQGLHPREVFRLKIDWGLTAVSVLIYMFANYIRGLAYTRGLDREIDRMTAFQIVGIGHALNMVLPLHAGEGLRFAFFPSDYSARRRTELLVIPATADFIAIILLSLLSIPLSGFRNAEILKTLALLSILCVAGCVLFFVVVLCVPSLRKHMKNYKPSAIAKMMAWVLLSWVLLLISTWVALVAFGFHWKHSLSLSLAVFAVTNIINFIPASPGAIGLFEYATILALGGLGIAEGTALSASLMLHLIQYIALLPMGAVLYLMAIHGKYGKAVKGIWKSNGKA